MEHSDLQNPLQGLSVLSKSAPNIPLNTLINGISNTTTTGITKLKPSEGLSQSAYTPKELCEYLLPTLDALWKQLPESEPFQQPVDPVKLNCPNYYEIIKKPIDLSTIRHRLTTEIYNDPWEYISDILLMFDNAWLFNKKTSRVFKYGTKLSEMFQILIEPVMKSMGYCCGSRYFFSPKLLFCYVQQCIIPKEGKYYSYLNVRQQASGFGPDRYILCQKCFDGFLGDTVILGDDLTQASTVIEKAQFKELRNDVRDLEDFVRCDCGRKLHKVCVLYLDSIWPAGFTCNVCLKKRCLERPPNRFTAKELPRTHLATYLENRVNNFLSKKNANTGEVTIRVLSNVEKSVEVMTGMREKFVDTGNMCGKFPYRAKTVFAFQHIDNTDVCFFGMHLQEYGSDCPSPNARCVYIAYLDSVHFFQPKEFRTSVYHEILLGYMNFAKKLGYTMAHIWACPPSDGSDYILYSHPPEQKIPKPKRLQDWYKRLLDKAITERIVHDYKDILRHMRDENIRIYQLPYFEGDIWPGKFEASIEEMNGSKFNGSNKRKRPNTFIDLDAKLGAVMAKHKREFFFIRLQPTQATSHLSSIQDPDPLIPCDLMDGRDVFLNMAMENHYEFSSLRRAKFSTMGFLYELHNQGMVKYGYNCNNCREHIRIRHHCTVCEDYDLCTQCYERGNHPHQMIHLRQGSTVDSLARDRMLAKREEARQQFLQLGARWLKHACECQDDDCRLPNCLQIKEAFKHTKQCTRKTNGHCIECMELVAIQCTHSQQCQDTSCLISSCQSLKRQLKKHQLLQLVKDGICNNNSKNGLVSCDMNDTDAETVRVIKQEVEELATTARLQEPLQPILTNSFDSTPRDLVHSRVVPFLTNFESMVRMRKRKQAENLLNPPLKIRKIQILEHFFKENLYTMAYVQNNGFGTVPITDESFLPKAQQEWFKEKLSLYRKQRSQTQMLQNSQVTQTNGCVKVPSMNPQVQVWYRDQLLLQKVKKE